jgi:hypothetical protein
MTMLASSVYRSAREKVIDPNGPVPIEDDCSYGFS